MQVHIEKNGDWYTVRIRVGHTGYMVPLKLTEDQARVLASDFERCSQAVFAVLPEVDQ